MKEQGGVIALLPAKGSVFNAVEWFWQIKVGHDKKAEADLVVWNLQEN